MHLGITGHRKLADPRMWIWVEHELKRLIDHYASESDERVTAISSLAIGADQIFADLVIKSGGELYAVIPFPNYRHDFSDDEIKEYSRLLDHAEDVEAMAAMPTRDESYLAAGKRVVDISEVVFAVWNGKKAAGLGGTGDIVEYAKQVRKKIVHLNPYEESVKIIQASR